VPEKTGAREGGEDFGGRGSSVSNRAHSATLISALPLKNTGIARPGAEGLA